MRAIVDIELNATGLGTVLVDGKPMTGVRATRITTEAGQISRVELEFIGDVHFRGEAEVDVKTVCPMCSQKLPEEQPREFGKDL